MPRGAPISLPSILQMFRVRRRAVDARTKLVGIYDHKNRVYFLIICSFRAGIRGAWLTGTFRCLYFVYVSDLQYVLRHYQTD